MNTREAPPAFARTKAGWGKRTRAGFWHIGTMRALDRSYCGLDSAGAALTALEGTCTSFEETPTSTVISLITA